MEALREDIKDACSKDKDTKDELDVFLMYAGPYYDYTATSFEGTFLPKQ